MMMKHPILNLGFRVFFASATSYGVIAMLLWMAAYSFSRPIGGSALPLMFWHGHEMVFGFAMAVVAGFLLTAVGNWTGREMPSGMALFVIWLPWFVARLVFVGMPQWAVLGIVCDLLFNALLLWAIGKPIVQIRQTRQTGILIKIILMLVANGLFLAGSLGWMTMGWYYGLYLGVFLILGLLLTIGRRVTPFFIGRGVGYAFEPKNSKTVDNLCLYGFVGFFLVELFTPWQMAASLIAGLTAIAQVVRLLGWHTPGIWKKPLLWSMMLSQWCITTGLVFYFLRMFFPNTFGNSLAMHTMAVGGIGIMALSMMARVSLGHTGRNVHQAPKVVTLALLLVSLSALVRVVLPMIAPQGYMTWIIIAQLLWSAAFLIVLVVYLPIWSTPRVDGKPG